MKKINMIVQFKLQEQFQNTLDVLSIQVRPFITLIPYILFVRNFGSETQLEYIVISFLMVLLCGNILIMSVLGMDSDLDQGRSIYFMLAPINFVQLSIANQLAWFMIAIIPNILTFILVTWLFQLHWAIEYIGLILSFGCLILLTMSCGTVISYVVIKLKNSRLIFYIFSIFMLMSGALYPINTMPSLFQKIAMFNPLIYPMELVRFYTIGKTSMAITNLWIMTIFLLFVCGSLLLYMKNDTIKRKIFFDR